MIRARAVAMLLGLVVAGCIGADPACEALPTRIELTLSADALAPANPAVCRDRPVTLVVTVQVDGVLHIHGYDEQVGATSVTAGEVTELAFTAPAAANFRSSSTPMRTPRASASASSRSMSPRAARAAATVAIFAVLATPRPAEAHAIGGTFQLPVPLWLYLAGAGIAVAASFVVTTFTSRAAHTRPPSATWPIPGGLANVARLALRLLGLAWWFGAIAVGFVVGDISPLPAVLLWIGIWVGLPIVAVVAGNPWPSLSPFRTTFAALEWAARRTGVDRLDLGLRYPPSLARWPAVLLLGAGIWAELILPGGNVAVTVAMLMTGYTLLTLAGMLLFGQIAWLRNAELFEVELGWFGRIGPLARRSRSAQLCAGCDEACDSRRCLDCPECSVAADDAERGPELRPWFVGLTAVGRPNWSDVAFIVLVLAGVTYDGMRETAIGAFLLSTLYPPIASILGATNAITFLVIETLQLLIVFALFLGAFVAIVTGTHALGNARSRGSLGEQAGRYAVPLLPIAGGYLIAHYLTLVLQGVVWLPSLVADPLMSLAPQLDAIPVVLVWYLSVAAIVGGHIAGIVHAHRLALRDAPGRATVAGLPMVALMFGYTVLSLWIIAAPIVVEPGTAPAALLP